ncbi:MAG: ABC transporter ATP-binding protein [Chloroflexota bacterium]
MNESAIDKSQPVIQVKNVAIAYETRYDDVVAVKDVSFDLNRGETLGIVGESGCGKSTLAYALVQYMGKNGKITKGDIIFNGRSMLDLSEDELRELRGDQLAMVFQDPMTSLNPVLRVGEQMMEVLEIHRNLSKSEAWDQCVDMLRRVNMPDPERVMDRFPHQISGGQQQRVVIGMSMLNNPAVLIMDEPTTALDVTVEATVLDIVNDLRSNFDTAIILISHNMGVIARVCERVGVMYAGEMVELASVEEVFSNPRHPYTQGLIRCLPKLGRSKEASILYPIPGRVPSPSALPPGCLFEPRCDYARNECRQQRPELRPFSTNHMTRCLFSEEIDASAWKPPKDAVSPLGDGNNVTASDDDSLLMLEGLQTYYTQSSSSPLSLIGLGKKEHVKAVDGVSLAAIRGKTLGVVGESGCGKSTLVKTIIGLEAKTGGDAQFMGFDIGGKVKDRDLNLVQELQMVFQNPESTMNPSYTVGQQIERPLRRFNVVPKDQIREEVVRLLRAVKLDEFYYNRLPRQLSGGEKQRVGIARALAGRPDLMLCDEPVSALDVSVQAAVLNLLLELQQQFGTTMMFIAHDLSVVRFFSDFIAVMYLGQVVEFGSAEEIYAPPYHPYTEALLSAVPIPDPSVKQERIRLEGSVPSPLNPPSGCRFHTRCPRRSLLPNNGAICEQEVPPWQEDGEDHRVFCHVPLEELRKLDPVIEFADEPV